MIKRIGWIVTATIVFAWIPAVVRSEALRVGVDANYSLDMELAGTSWAWNSERPDLFGELVKLGYIVERGSSGMTGYYVPTEPVDQRKPFLEHMMRLPARENDETNAKIWREIGEALAVTQLECQRILEPGCDERFLFGRLVKNPRCFALIVEGARRIKRDAAFTVAGTGMANTPLMKALESHPQYTVAQFAQAIGAVYYANR